MSYLDNIEKYNNEPIEVGYYYINKKVNFNNYFEFFPSWMPQVLVNFLLKKNFISKKNIKYKIECRKCLPANTFKPFVEDCYKIFSEKEAKNVVNSCVGYLGLKHRTETEGFFTIQKELANAFKLEDLYNVSINTFKDKYFISKTTRHPVLTNSMGIHQHILAMTIIRLYNMTETLMGPNSVLYGFTHDCVYLSNANEIKLGKGMGEIDTEQIFDEEVLFGEVIKQTRGKKQSERPLFILEKENGKNKNSNWMKMENLILLV
jgi:hypothetical protein